MFRTSVAVALSGLTLLSVSSVSCQSTVLSSATGEYQVVTVADGLENPWSMAFLPGGDILVTEGPLPAVRSLHSMVIVAVQPHISVRGFNNMGTFHGAGGIYNRTTAGYDAFDLPIDDPHYSKVEKIMDFARQMGRITGKLMRITKYETKDYVQGVKIVDIDRAAGEEDN